MTATFVGFAILRNLYHSARTVAQAWKIALPAAALRTMRNDPGYWGGQISHFGVAVLALGITLSANLTVAAEVVLSPGESASVAGYDITYVNQFTREESNRSVIGAALEISRNGNVISQQEPRLNQYGASGMTVATPAVDEYLTGDLYLSLRTIDPESVTLEVWWFPFIWMVWVGGFLAGFAMLWSRLVHKPKRESKPTERVSTSEN